MVCARDSALILLGAFLIRYGLHTWIEPYGVFHFFMIACVVIAIRYGYKFAFISLIISYFVANYFFIKPYGQFGDGTTSDLIQAFNFFLVTAVSILVIEKLQRTVYSQKLMIQVMRDRQRSLLFQKNEMMHKIRSLGGQP